jgi:hypothetical protein
MQLSLEVVDVALGSNQLILSVLQSGTGVVKVVSLEVVAAISPHQLITQLPDACLQAGVLLQKLSVALLDVLDDAVLGLHLIDALLQTKVLVSAHRCDLLKQGAHVLGVVCGKRPTSMVGQKLEVVDGGHALTPHCVALIPNGEQGNGGVTENWQVALTELHEGLVGSPLQSVVEVVPLSHGKPSGHGQVGGVSRNAHMDHAAPQPELMVQTTAICRTTHVAEAVQHVLEQGGKPGAVQPITTEPSVGSKGGVGVVIHLSKQGGNESTFHPSNRDNKPKLQNKPQRQQNVNSDSVFSNDNLVKLR